MMFRKKPASRDPANRPRAIGIPQALVHYLYPALWETFFLQLGFKVVVSAPTSRALVEQAGLVSEAEHCFPVKLYDAHLESLAGVVDAVFVPRLLSSLAGHIACPKLGALPDCARAQFSGRFSVLSVEINETKIPLKQSLVELGHQLGAEGKETQRAVDAALEAMRRAVMEREAVAKDGSGPVYLLMGHPYNLYDPYLSEPIVAKLRSLGVCPQRLPLSDPGMPAGPVHWDTCSIIWHRLEQLQPDACAGVVQLSSFNCGCDSIVSALYRDLLMRKGIPCMTLILDEHAGLAGVETRLEAFVDSIGDAHG